MFSEVRSKTKGKIEPLDRWAPQTAMVSATINFAIAIGRLEDRGNVHDEEESEEEEARTKLLIRELLSRRVCSYT